MHWDSVYFHHIALHGYLYEQEHAFGPLLPLLLRYFNPILLGCVCHYIAVIALYRASLNATSSERISKIASILHIVSPAGIFLCIGYTEPLFCALTFSGLAMLHKRPKLATFLFGLSGLTRATGIINVFYFFPKRPDPARLIKAGLSAAIICGPWFLTQIVAYIQYCPGRPWCTRFPPVIYSFVQDHYWHVGFGRYFTLNNLPLFILSGPSYLLCLASLDVSFTGIQQGLLTFLTFTTAHAQIITRMMSAFPGVYWYLARRVVQENEDKRWRIVVRLWVLYGLCQAVLFGAFLPPA
jgi:phosphatidylinositol glycan class V